MSEQAQPIPGQDPATTVPAAEAVAAPTPAAGPWVSDLESRFSDPEVRSQVDAFLRETVQPHVTQVEQSNSQALTLYNDFNSKPRETLLEIAEELYGEDAAKAFTDWMDAQGQTPAAPDPANVQPPGESPARDPEVQALLDERQAAREKAAFDAEFERVKQAHPGVHFDYDLFLPVVADTGDFDQAVGVYQSKFGPYLEFAAQQAANPPAAPTAPATLGVGEASGATEVPTEKEYQSLDEAIDDWFAEGNATGEDRTLKPPAPPVATT